jgi:hypothetical protein
MMKNKIKAAFSAATVVALTAPALAMAQFSTPEGTNLPSGSVTGIVTNVMNWMLTLVGILGVIGFAIAGILYLTAAGDEERIKVAKRAMMYSILGVVIALIGLVVIKAVSSALGGSTSNF